MAEVFRSGKDLHTETARAILGLGPDDELTDEQRQTGKTYNFLTIYGGGPGKAAASLGIPYEVAKEQQDVFHSQWPAIKLLHNPPNRNGYYRRGESPGAIQRVLAERGYITTLWGRHLHPHSPHVALNALVQSCAADLMRASLVKVHANLRAKGCTSHLVNVVHDEMILDCVEDELDYLVATVPTLMCDWPAITEHVPVEVDAEYSTKSWADKGPLPGNHG